MSGAKPTLMTNEDLLISPEMVDKDNGREPFFTTAGCLTEGCSGSKPIDTLYENFTQTEVERPREGSTPAPVRLRGPMYPHRNL